jgi:nucleoside-diphosphate-sugar epimerase
MRVLVTGCSGVVGRHPVPLLAKAMSGPGWTLRYPSWRQGFKEELA